MYTGRMISGAGIASRMHDRRIGPVEEMTGALYPGTLNLDLSGAFDWDAPHDAVTVPDARDWQNLDGEWFTSTMRVYPVAVGGIDAWVVRLDRSRAPANRVEVVAPVRLRDVLSNPVTMGHA